MLRFLKWFAWILAGSMAGLCAQEIVLAETEVVASSGDVVVAGSLSRSAVRVGERLRFWIQVRNGSQKPILDVRLVHLDAPGYEVIRRCWCGTPDAACGSSPSVLATAPATCDVLGAELKPGSSLTVWGDLRSTAASASQTLSAVVRYSHDGTFSYVLTSLGQAASKSHGQELREFFKDFGLPIVVVLLPFIFAFFQWLVGLVEKKAAEVRTQISQTWNQMLPESHKFAMRHYVHIHSYLSEAITRLEKYRKITTEDPSQTMPIARRAFYALMMFERRVQFARRTVGGLYFKHRMGEELANRCHRKWRELYGVEVEQNRLLLIHVLRKLSPNTEFDHFLAKLDDPTRPLERGWEYFQQWIRDERCGEAIPYLKGLRDILKYEMNRPYEYWYGSRELLQLDPEAEKVLPALGGLGGSPEEKFRGEVSAYLGLAKGLGISTRLRSYVITHLARRDRPSRQEDRMESP